MSTLHIVTVVGARPQFIKAAPVSRSISRHDDLHETVVHTGQHYDAEMSAVFLDEVGLREPAYNLEAGSGTHGEQTARMLVGLEAVLRRESPDLVLVYGDTNSTLAGALAAAQSRIACAHVEAGLRSFNRAMVEEVNRVVVDRLAALLFAPTETAVSNLVGEGIERARIHLVGDVMLDAFRLFGPAAEKESTMVESLGLRGRDYVLATVHRAENTDSSQRLGAIIEGLQELSDDVVVVLPLHPRTRAALVGMGHHVEDFPPGLLAMPPIGYFDMIALVSSADLVATDSGGLQKEAYFAGVPCVTLRHETEWLELVDSGWNRLVPPTSAREICDRIISAIGSRPARRSGLFGDGHAADDIVGAILASR
jgi:UDP-GlcNAc3NAcA epimerase